MGYMWVYINTGYASGQKSGPDWKNSLGRLKGQPVVFGGRWPGEDNQRKQSKTTESRAGRLRIAGEESAELKTGHQKGMEGENTQKKQREIKPKSLLKSKSAKGKGRQQSWATFH